MTQELDPTVLAQKIKELERTVARRDEALASLKNKAQYFDALKNNTSDLIHSVTTNGEFLFVNRAWRETLGYSNEDLKTLRLMDIVDPACLKPCQLIFQDLLAGEKIDRNITVFIAKNGRKINVEGRCKIGRASCRERVCPSV